MSLKRLTADCLLDVATRVHSQPDCCVDYSEKCYANLVRKLRNFVTQNVPAKTGDSSRSSGSEASSGCFSNHRRGSDNDSVSDELQDHEEGNEECRDPEFYIGVVETILTLVHVKEEVNSDNNERGRRLSLEEPRFREKVVEEVASDLEELFRSICQPRLLDAQSVNDGERNAVRGKNGERNGDRNGHNCQSTPIRSSLNIHDRSAKRRRITEEDKQFFKSTDQQSPAMDRTDLLLTDTGDGIEEEFHSPRQSSLQSPTHTPRRSSNPPPNQTLNHPQHMNLRALKTQEGPIRIKDRGVLGVVVDALQSPDQSLVSRGDGSIESRPAKMRECSPDSDWDGNGSTPGRSAGSGRKINRQKRNQRWRDDEEEKFVQVHNELFISGWDPVVERLKEMGVFRTREQCADKKKDLRKYRYKEEEGTKHLIPTGAQKIRPHKE